MIFRELMSWDYTVPDYYFDENLMLDRKLQEQLKETYFLPTRTFWRPVYFDGHREPNLVHPEFAMRLRDYSVITPEIQRILDKHDIRNVKPPRRGVLVSYLRPYDAKNINDQLRFDKYYASGEYHEQKDLEILKSKIDIKLTQMSFDAADKKFGNPYV